MVKAWCYAWAYLYIMADWLQDKIDHSDFFAGAVFATVLIGISWLSGLFNVLMGG